MKKDKIGNLLLKTSLSKDYISFNHLAYKIFYTVVADVCNILRNAPMKISKLALKGNRLSSVAALSSVSNLALQEQSYCVDSETGAYDPNFSGELTLARYVRTEKGFKAVKLSDYLLYSTNLLEVSQNAAKTRLKSFFENELYEWESLADKAESENKLNEFFKEYLEELVFRVDYEAFSSSYELKFKKLQYKAIDLRRYSQLNTVSTVSNACLLICSGALVAEKIQRERLSRFSNANLDKAGRPRPSNIGVVCKNPRDCIPKLTYY